MDGTMTQNTRQLSADQVKRLEPGTFVEIYDPENNMAERCRIVQYGREKRLQSLRRDNVYYRIKEMHGHIFRMGV